MKYKFTEEELKLLIDTAYLSGMIHGVGIRGLGEEEIESRKTEALETLLLAVSSFKTQE